MDLPKLVDLTIANRKVIVRADLDVDPENFKNDLRIKSLIPTLDFLKEKNASIILIGHRGRPDGKNNADLSLMPFREFFNGWGAEVKENLRFDLGEEANDSEYAKKLATLGDVYVNEAFASSHRESASIVGLPKLLPHAAGFRFGKEVENLSRVLELPKRPLVFIISGLKEDKLQYIKSFESLADRVLVGGRLPDYMGDETLVSIRSRTDAEKIFVGNLIMDKEDITLNTIEIFEKEIKKAGTIVVSGPLGKYEDRGHSQGTERVFKAVATSGAFRVAGGGDTEKAISTLNLSDGFDWISVGGGAMLEFLSKKTLPGIEALKQ